MVIQSVQKKKLQLNLRKLLICALKNAAAFNFVLGVFFVFYIEIHFFSYDMNGEIEKKIRWYNLQFA